MLENQIPPPIQNPNQIRTWNMLCHLSVLIGLIIPLGNFLGPFLVWQFKKTDIPSVVAHAKAALNFQLTVFIGFILIGATGVFLAFVCIGYLLIPLAFLILLCGFIFPIILGIKANNGEPYTYPFYLDFIK
jgi:uncharacterized protein